VFEAAEVGSALPKERYKALAEKLRVDLLDAQKELAGSGLSLAVLIGGVEGSGKTEFANLLLSWLDARGVETFALDAATDEERERPFFWRFWRVLPPAGRSQLLLGSWYTEPIVARVFKQLKPEELDFHLDRAADFERMLVQEGVVLVKLWLHLSKKEQKKRFKALEADKDTRWRVTALDWRFHRKYDRFRKVCERALMKTDVPGAPWRVVEASDRRWRDATGARAVLETMKERLAEAKAPKPAPRPDRPKPAVNNVLRKLDLSLKFPDEEFEEELESLQGRIGSLTRKLRKKNRSMIIGFEGPDAAGKGGAIRRLSAAMDARLYTVKSVAAPTDEEKAHPYLWRFWRSLPRQGRVTVYDRTWYGRVLVERIEGFAAPAEWKRAFAEINAFEEQLDEFGTIVLKFWLAVSPEEQLRRFKSRKKTPFKQYKITDEDWRNREKWDAYEAAACEMIERTSTERAPWVLVEGENKNWARIKVLKTVAERLEKEL
jgi:AMP-polyphosphate phosphotransferase